MRSKAIDIVIMAAGKGTRMKSSLPKVLQPLGGRPMLHHVLDTASQLGARRAVVITGHQSEQVQTSVAQWQTQQSAGAAASAATALRIDSVLQNPQQGTGHAVQQAAPVLEDDGVVVVLSGDVPLIQSATLKSLVEVCGGDGLALLTIQFADPSGYGRIVKNAQGEVQAIVEQKDASDEQKRIGEVYSGMMAVPAQQLKKWLTQLDNNNAQGEYYLTDIVKHAVADGVSVRAHRIDDALQVAGVNSPLQLAELERAHQNKQARELMEAGVRLLDPARIDVRGSLRCGQDVEIDVNCVFEGQVTLGDGVRIGAHCVIKDCTIQAAAQIAPFCHLDGAQVGAGASIGPYARLRPGADLGDAVHIGNFVEVKNSRMAKGAKANHLAYLGDADVGERVNYGAGCITANYDGANKHRTVIEADVHVGSNSVLVAPVTIGLGGTVGAGSVVSKPAAPGSLTVARARQVSIEGWQRPQKKKGA